jgi:hypothetical protein
MREHRRPVVGRPVAQPESDPRIVLRRRGRPRADSTPERARRAREELLERLVEAADAPEARRQRDVAHAQPRLVNELLREENAAGLGHGERRGAEVTLEEAPELARAHAQALPQGLDARVVAVEFARRDERKRSGDGVRGPAPGGELRRRLRPAAQARTIPRRLRGGRRGIEPAVLQLGWPRRAHGTAVDPRRRDRDEEAAVKSLVARPERVVANVGVEHRDAETVMRTARGGSRFSDIVAARPPEHGSRSAWAPRRPCRRGSRYGPEGSRGCYQ